MLDESTNAQQKRLVKCLTEVIQQFLFLLAVVSDLTFLPSLFPNTCSLAAMQTMKL